MGTFDEGNCLKLKLKNGYSYIICSVNSGKISGLMDYIYRAYKGRKEKKNDVFGAEIHKDTNFSVDNEHFDMEQYIKDEMSGKKSNEIVDIGDWTVCDHVCGGGTQTKYKGCKPPQGGHQCSKKPAKLQRACNTQPCKSGENSGKLNLPDEEWKFKQPTITLPVGLDSRYVSHRFQQ